MIITTERNNEEQTSVVPQVPTRNKPPKAVVSAAELPARGIEDVRIENIVCSERTEAKLESKHHVTLRDARQIFFSRPRIRFAEKGHTVGEDVYAFGQTLGGRYLSVFFI
ncbi:MAG: hypothetical protein QOD33_1343 [Pyrinomonadaceae bacterium]|jgi:hypothetical protein|nr:hypothetical protein [Pyrinomonadaceae bacterium]